MKVAKACVGWIGTYYDQSKQVHGRRFHVYFDKGVWHTTVDGVPVRRPSCSRTFALEKARTAMAGGTSCRL